MVNQMNALVVAAMTEPNHPYFRVMFKYFLATTVTVQVVCYKDTLLGLN